MQDNLDREVMFERMRGLMTMERAGISERTRIFGFISITEPHLSLEKRLKLTEQLVAAKGK